MRVICCSFHPKLQSLPIQPPSSAGANKRPPQLVTVRARTPFSINAAPQLVTVRARTPFSINAARCSNPKSGGRIGSRDQQFEEEEKEVRDEWKWAMVGAASVGVAMVMMGIGVEEARAMGPEGPLVEEFWDNVRRYGLYVLTVSTGAIYTIAQPILELLKTPVTAILIIAVLVGGFYLVSLVLSAMFGITEYAYQYGY